MQHPVDPQTDPSLGHELRDVRFGSVYGAAAGVVVLVVVSFALMWGMLKLLVWREDVMSPPASPLAQSYARREPPEPRLQIDPIGDLAALRAREVAQLAGYGWVDRQAGVVRIPIDRAMELLVARRGGAAR
ncbi:MAG: hypothetical protein KIT14_23975 [bacterium]|nr:hypothetical protein [bacterium]